MSFSKRFLQVLKLSTPFIVGILSWFLNSSESWRDTFTEPSLLKLLTPAPITFAIWGPIFILLTVFLLYQSRDFLLDRESIEMPYVQEISVFFFLSSLFSGLWYIAWSRRMIWVSIGLMILYYMSLLAAYFRMGINKSHVSRKERILVTGGWSMYTGWITVATVVNTTTGLVYYGFDRLPFTELHWTVVVSFVAVVVYLAFLFKRDDSVFAGVGVWAFTGLVLTHLSDTPPSNNYILALSALSALTIAASIIYKEFIARHVE